jgi:membrane protein implicated in regulation of membrane protease activity
MPEWYLAIAGLAVLTAAGALWPALWIALPLLAFAIAIPIAQAMVSIRGVTFAGSARERLRARALTAVLHVLQPIARLRGRLRHGLSPWRARGKNRFAWPGARTVAAWTERWRAPEARLHGIEQTLRADGAVVRRGGDYERWDLESRGGLFGAARLIMGVEEHGQGRQMVRARLWPRASAGALWTVAGLAGLAAVALLQGSGAAAGVLALGAAALGARIAWECGTAVRALGGAVDVEVARDR